MKQLKIGATLAIGGIIIAITCMLFFILTEERTAAQWASFVFILLAEMIAMIGTIVVGKYAKQSEATMMIAGMFIVITAYTILSIIISLLFVTGLFNSVTAIVTIQLVLLALAAIISIVLTVFAKSSSQKDKTSLQEAAGVKQIQDDIFILMNDERNTEYKDKLTKIYEAIRYCDNTTHTPSDDKIAIKVIELETALQNDSDEKMGEIEELLNSILLLAKKRSIEAQNANRGGI